MSKPNNNIVDEFGRKIGYTVPTTFDNMHIFLKDEGTDNYSLRGECANFSYFCTLYGLGKLQLIPTDDDKAHDLPDSPDESWMVFAAVVNQIMKNVETEMAANKIRSQQDGINLARRALVAFSAEDLYSALDFQYQIMGQHGNQVLVDYQLTLSYKDKITAAFENKVSSYTKLDGINNDVDSQIMVLFWNGVI